MSGPRPASWLVAVDLQRIFATGPWGAPRFDELVEPVRALAAAFGPERTRFTRFVVPARPEGAWQTYYAAWPFAVQPPDSADYALADAFAEHRGRTLDVPTFGKWDVLREVAGVRPGDVLTVCGVSTDCCVLSTALGAADAGVAVRVVTDACAAPDDEAHARALAALAPYAPLVELVTTADVLAG